MMENGPMTVQDLIRELSGFRPDLPVTICMEAPETDEDSFHTFIREPFITMRGGQQTYLGDKDIVRIKFMADEV